MTAQRRVLVTGGTGVIGAWVVRELAENGYQPYVFTRGSTTVGNPILRPVEPHIGHVAGDIEDPWSLAAALTEVKPEFIVHFATVKPWQIDAAYTQPKPMMGVRNLMLGTANVLEAARVFGVGRIVMASTKGVYADFIGDYGAPTFKRVPESYPCEPSTMYGLGKLTGERLAAYYHDTFGLDVVSFRFATTYGPFKRGPAEHPPGLISRALAGDEVELAVAPGALDVAKDDYLYNRDIGRAVVRACEAGTLGQLVYNIGTGRGRTMRDVLAALNTVAPGNKVRLTVGEDVPSKGGVSGLFGIFDTSAAQRDLGFEAAYDLAAGVAETAEILSGIGSE